MASGIGGHLIEKYRKDRWFTRNVLGTERLFGHNLHMYKKAKTQAVGLHEHALAGGVWCHKCQSIRHA